MPAWQKISAGFEILGDDAACTWWLRKIRAVPAQFVHVPLRQATGNTFTIGHDGSREAWLSTPQTCR